MPDLPDLTLETSHLPPGRARLGSFCAFTLRPGQIGFVLYNRPPADHPGPPARAHSWARGPNWVRFAYLPLGPRPRGPSHPAPNWVRFARFTPRPSHVPHGDRLCPHTPVTPSLASFCTISGGKCEVRGLKFEVRGRDSGLSWPDACNSTLDTPVRPPRVRPVQIGFVLRICPPAGRRLSIRSHESPIRNLGPRRPTPLIDVCRAVYVVHKSKHIQIFLHP
jgi:hypothetical protein